VVRSACRGQPGAQHLERDALVELGVERLVHAAHAAGAEPAHDAVAPGDQLDAVGQRGARHRDPLVRDGVVFAADGHERRA